MPATPAIPGQGRPEPPPELSDREKKIWVACVENRPLGYFDASTWPLLKAYCMHAVQAQDLAAALFEQYDFEVGLREARTAT